MEANRRIDIKEGVPESGERFKVAAIYTGTLAVGVVRLMNRISMIYGTRAARAVGIPFEPAMPIEQEILLHTEDIANKSVIKMHDTFMRRQYGTEAWRTQLQQESQRAQQLIDQRFML